MPQLRSEIASLELDGSAELLGRQPNPYALMARADCFVLSSDYEGQPMVLLEALVLGLPVVSTAFATARDTIPQGGGLIVERDVDALADGMRRFLAGDVRPAPFDAKAYNRQAAVEFGRAIGAVD